MVNFGVKKRERQMMCLQYRAMPILIPLQDSTCEEHMGTLKEKKDLVIHILCAPLHDSTCTKLVEKHGGISIMLALAPSFTSAASSWVIG
jgi:hypothetical protein